MAKKKVLVTGTAGFILSNFIRKAIYWKSDLTFISIDKVVSPGSKQNVFVNRDHTFYIGDTADSHLVNLIFEIEKPEFVIHGAAESFVDHAIANANPFVHSNVLGTQVMIDAAVKYGVEKFIYLSTDEVLGQLKENDPPWTEEAQTAPRNPYSASKLAGELMVQAAHHTHGLQYNITRSCNNFGPRQPPRNLIPKIIKNIIDNQPIPIYGQGMQMREWIYVDDNCEAILHILNHGKPNEIYNISSGNEIRNIEICQKICNLMESGHSLISFVEDRKGHDFRYAIDSSKLRSLGWVPKNKFNDALKMCIKWYLDNKWFLR